MFMVAGIYFLRELLLFRLHESLLRIRSSSVLSLLICAAAAVLSAFLDALTVVAVVMTVGLGFYQVFHRVASGKRLRGRARCGARRSRARAASRYARAVPRVPARADDARRGRHRARRRHDAGRRAAEPADRQAGGAGNFGEFFLAVAPVSMPVAVAGFGTCWLVERLRWFGYGTSCRRRPCASAADDHEEQRVASAAA